jgi:phosphinothricin acetyltransferase
LAVRRAGEGDAGSILAIYNDAVASTVATFDTEPRSLEGQFEWLREHDPPYVILVGESGGKVIGWASLSRWSDRKAYAETAEVSVYVDARMRGKGVGRRLLARLVEEGARSPFHTLLARVADGNAASLRLHESLGFRPVGVMKEVGFKFGRRIDVHLLQLVYPDPPTSGERASRGTGRPISGGVQS